MIFWMSGFSMFFTIKLEEKLKNFQKRSLQILKIWQFFISEGFELENYSFTSSIYIVPTLFSFNVMYKRQQMPALNLIKIYSALNLTSLGWHQGVLE